MRFTKEYALQFERWLQLMGEAHRLRKACDFAGLALLLKSLPTQNLLDSQRETIAKRIKRYHVRPKREVS